MSVRVLGAITAAAVLAALALSSGAAGLLYAGSTRWRRCRDCRSASRCSDAGMPRDGSAARCSATA